MARSYEKRREDRIVRLQHLADFLRGRVEAGASRNEDRDKAQYSALLWAIEEIGRFDTVEAAIRDESLSPLSKLIAIGALVNARHEPSEADILRTRQLFRGYVEEPEAGVR